MRLFVTLTLVAAVAGLKCRTSLDLVMRWSVDCSSMNLSSAPAAMIIHPVVSLNMTHNSFLYLKESQFINWTDISILDLSFNKIQSIDRKAFKGLSNLTELYLNNNGIQVLTLNITNYLIKLKVLSVSHNKLNAIESTVFNTVPSILKLYLGHNTEFGRIENNLIPIKSILNRSLITLGLENISLPEIPKDFFSNASHLIYLNLALNPLQNVSHLPDSLRYLNISGTLVVTISNDSFPNLQLIQKLSIESMPYLKEIKAESFSGLVNINELHLRNCSKLQSISESAFGDSHPKLRKVDLSYCGLTSLPRGLEPVLSEVESLDLQGNPWDCDASVSWLLDLNLGTRISEMR
jgi:Leucine-rich repeat (LRR) protein